MFNTTFEQKGSGRGETDRSLERKILQRRGTGSPDKFLDSLELFVFRVTHQFKERHFH